MVAISTTLQLQNQYAQLFVDLGYFLQFRMMVKPFFLFMDTEDEMRYSELAGKIAFDHFFVLDESTSAIAPLYEKELNDFVLRQVGEGNTLVISAM